MPIYEYRCRICGATSDFLFTAGHDEIVSCKTCGSPEIERLISAPSFLARPEEHGPGHTCCGREERCEAPPCSGGGGCRRD